MASTARLDELKKKFEENPRRYFAPLANEHRKSGDLDQAIALCRTHLPQQPAHISGHIVLAQALFEAGGLDEAREIFHTALGLDPENLIALRYLGDIARESDDVTTARQWYQRVLEVDPRNDEIVQLVRDLDAPRAKTVEAPETAPSAAEAEIAKPSTPALTAENNPRFAPLALEPMDLETGDLPEAAASPEGNAVSESKTSGADGSFDVHASWNTESPTVDLPMIDAPEIDPFDLNPAASAESLYDASAEAPTEDFFLTELSQPVVPDEVATQPAESEFAAADSWFPAAEAQPSVPKSPSEPKASFDEGSFHLEPPPGAPADAASVVEASVDGSHADDGVWDLPNAPADSPVETASAEREQVFEAAASVEELPEAQLRSDLADSATAEWHAPPPSAPAETTRGADDLGLEVMEFVPPSSDLSFAPSPAATPETLPIDQDATPASFVTETMAELYLQQGFRDEALAVYRELLARNPADANLRERVQQIESGSMSSIGMATLSENVVESALKRQSARPARSVRSFFASFAGRRAPATEPREVDASASSEASYAQAEDIVAEAAPAEPTEFAAAAEESNLSADQAPDSGHITPLASAAETLATFDPFADPGDMSPDVSVAPAAEIAPAAEAPPITPNVESVTQPSASAAASTEPARRSLEDLFPDTPIAARTEVVAQTLATAFGRPEPQGRPTRAASSELSLDNVFRGAPEGGAPPADGGFSFDQFFSDARPAGSDVAAAISPPEAGRSGGGAGDAHDIEQFTAWLEGLKKK